MSLQSTNWEGNWIEPVFNLPHFSDLAANDIVAPMLRNKPLPSSFLLPFIHETIHHQCFSARVGIALAILNCTYKRLVDTKNAQDLRLARLYYRKALMMRTILTPVVEGIALFAEYDAYPLFNGLGRFNNLSVLFCQDASTNNIEKSVEIFRNLLRTERLRGETQNRFCSILADPLMGGQHYLLGYMLVQSMSLKVRGEHTLFRDTLNILSLLIDYFFDDNYLAALLINEPKEGDENEVLEYLMQRINYFCFTNVNKIYDKISDFHKRRIEALEIRNLSQGEILPIFAEDEEKQRIGFDRLSKELQKFDITLFDQHSYYNPEDDDYIKRLTEQKSDGSVSDESIDWWVYKHNQERMPRYTRLLMNRNTINLGDIQVNFKAPKVVPARFDLIQNNRIFGTLPMTEPYPQDDYERPGWLTVYYSIVHHSLCFVLRGHGNILGVHTIGNPPGFYLDSLSSINDFKDGMIWKMRKDNEIYNQLLEADVTFKGETQTKINEIKSALERKLIPIALWDFKSPYWSQIEPLVCKKGYLGLFKKTSHLRTFALFRICLSQNMSQEEMEKAFESFGYDYSSEFDAAADGRVIPESPVMIKY